MESPFLHAHGLLRYVGLFLSGVCHQLPEHSFLLTGMQLPLCARCTGTYVGALLALCNLWLKRRQRAARLPALRVMVVLGVLFLLWGADGLNSYLQFLTGSICLYPPSNLLRLVTGLGMGLSVTLLVLPMLNLTLWRDPHEERVIAGLKELGVLLAQALAVAILVQTRLGALFYPLLVADVLSVLLVLSLVNATIVVILLRRVNHAEHWRQALLPLGLGLLLSAAEVGGIGLLRHALASILPWALP